MPVPAIPNLAGDRVLRLLILCLGLLAAPCLQARDYAVEILVFDRSGVSGEVEEQWNPGSNSQLSNLEQLQALTGRVGDHPFRPQVGHLARLQRGLLESGYRILHAASWQQPAAVYQNAPVVPVGAPDAPIQGAVRVYRTSLIFADIVLGLTDVLPDPGTTPRTATAIPTMSGHGTVPDPWAPLYFINEKRRVKFKEIHYFDHPRFGALLTVWPVEQ